MPLNKKGKKILASMEKRYGTKKGKSVFYAMENSGKLKGIKAASGSAVDTGDLGSEAANVAANQSAMASLGGGNNNATDPGIATDSITSFSGNLRARQQSLGLGNIIPGAGFMNAIGALRDTMVGKQVMGTKDKNKVQTPQATLATNDKPQLCPDGTYPPCKTPETQKFEYGGSVVISSNVDKSLL